MMIRLMGHEYLMVLMLSMRICRLVCGCSYEEVRKNQKILVGYDLSSRDRCVIHHTPIPRNKAH